jgi:pilus assembly protein CpaB
MQIVSGRRGLGGNSAGLFSGRKPLLLALTLGLLAAYLSWNYVQDARQNAKQAALVPVVVAAADIPVRTLVTPQMLQIKQLPADARHPKALTAPEQVNGKVTNLPIAAGEQVLSTKFFARKEDSGLAFRVPPGRRAVSVNVSEVVTSGGLIVPGDFVDVISIFPPGSQDEKGAQDMAGLVLQNIEVLAIAQSLQGVSEVSGPAAALNTARNVDPKQDAVARPNARTATLAVTPEEAQKLILAEERGKIRLALRAVDDHDTVAVGPTQLRDIKR